MATSRSILIAGGGIAGLTAALCLSRRGFRVDVFERTKASDPVGAGIQLSPNALHILDDLGVGKQLRLTATTPQGIRISSAATAQQIAAVPLGGDAIVEFGLPYLCVHRFDLQQALLTACQADPDISLYMDAKVTDATSHPNGVSALVQNGTSIETYRGAAIVLADGVRSSMRDALFELPFAKHSGFEAWRAMLPARLVPNSLPLEFTHLVLGKNRHAVLYPVRNAQHLNIVIVNKTRSRELSPDKNVQFGALKPSLKNWSEELVSVFEQAEEWSLWPLLQAPRARQWAKNNIVMIGDAAHGMVPFAAQGAAMAIEDAEVLAQQMAQADNPETAFSAYQKLRMARVRKVEKLASSNGQLYHMGWPFSAVRNLGMRVMPPKRLLARQAWIYNWRA